MEIDNNNNNNNDDDNDNHNDNDDNSKEFRKYKFNNQIRKIKTREKSKYETMRKKNADAESMSYYVVWSSEIICFYLFCSLSSMIMGFFC